MSRPRTTLPFGTFDLERETVNFLVYVREHDNGERPIALYVPKSEAAEIDDPHRLEVTIKAV